MSSGLAEAARYDHNGRCLAKVSSTARALTSETPWVRQFKYSGEGDLLETRDSAAGNTRYEYDAAHRLRQAIADNGALAIFRHDAGDNLLEQPGLAGVSISKGNQLRSANGDDFEYDDRGNVAVRRGHSGVTRYRYDSRNMLVSCQTPRGEWRATYDPLGRRVRKSCGEEWREFYWDTDRLAAELHHDGRLRVYVYADAFAMVPLLFLDYDDPDADPSTGRRYFLQCDHLGAPVRVEDEEGDVMWRARVTPYGSIVVSDKPLIEMPLRFPGHYFDPETGLHCNRFRYYNPELGRYLQSDPLGTAAGNNLYAYTANPLKEVDVRGDCPTDDTAGDPNEQNKTTEAGQKPGGPASEKPSDDGKFPGRTPESDAAAEAAVKAMNDPKNGLTEGEKSRMVVGLSTQEGSKIVGISGKDVQSVIDKIGPDLASQGIVVAPATVDTSTLTTPQTRRDGSTFPGSDNSCGEAKAYTQAGQMGETPNGQTAMWGNPSGKTPTGVSPDPPGSNVYPPCNGCKGNESNIVNLSRPGKAASD